MSHTSKRTRPPLTLPEYERLFRTIHAVVANEEGDPSKACLFFGIAGAYLLSHHHRLKSARPIVGFAGYNLCTPTNLSVFLGGIEKSVCISDEDHFHCWIEIDGWIVDLTAPLFNEMVTFERAGKIVPRLMFQKPAEARAIHPDGLNNAGAFIHVPNPELTVSLMANFGQKKAHADLVSICTQWYVPPPKKMAPFVGIGDQAGRIKQVGLSKLVLEGAW